MRRLRPHRSPSDVACRSALGVDERGNPRGAGGKGGSDEHSAGPSLSSLYCCLGMTSSAGVVPGTGVTLGTGGGDLCIYSS